MTKTILKISPFQQNNYFFLQFKTAVENSTISYSSANKVVHIKFLTLISEK